jgi:hypothetical protein
MKHLTLLWSIFFVASVATPAFSQIKPIQADSSFPVTRSSTHAPNDSIYVHMLNIPLSLITNPTPALIPTCKANVPEPIPVDTAAINNARDTLLVRVMDGDTTAALPANFQIGIQVADSLKIMTAGMKSLRFVGKARQLGGAGVSVLVVGSGRLICTAILARPARGSEASYPPQAIGNRREFELRNDDEAVVSIGTSFDFLDGVRTADLYADLRIFSPSLWPRRTIPRRWGIGVQAGIYQGRISSPSSSTPDSLQSFVFDKVVQDTLIRERQYRRQTSRRQNNLGLYLGVNAQLAQDLYWVVAQMEVRKEDVRLSIRDTTVADTTFRSTPSRVFNEKVIPVSHVFGSTAYIPSFTTGLRLDMHRAGLDLILQPLVGASLRGCSFDFLVSPNTGVRRACSNELHFLHWEITYEVEAPKSGIKLGGEVRGFGSNDPEILVYLAKEFTLQKLSELITSKH